MSPSRQVHPSPWRQCMVTVGELTDCIREVKGSHQPEGDSQAENSCMMRVYKQEHTNVTK